MTLSHDRGGQGEPLLLIHGIGSQWQVWNPVRPLLEPHREVVAIDLPGFGDSPPLPGVSVATAPVLADAVEAFLDEIGWDAPHVAGNSLGGFIALELAKRGRARTAIGLSPAGFSRGWDHQWLMQSLRLSRAAGEILAPRADAAARNRLLHATVAWQLVGHPTRMPPEDLAGALRALGRGPGWSAALAGLDAIRFGEPERVPPTTTIAWGERDRLLLLRQSERARQALPQARHVLLTDCGHVPTWDGPQTVAQAILSA